MKNKKIITLALAILCGGFQLMNAAEPFRVIEGESDSGRGSIEPEHTTEIDQALLQQQLREQQRDELGFVTIPKPGKSGSAKKSVQATIVLPETSTWTGVLAGESLKNSGLTSKGIKALVRLGDTIDFAHPKALFLPDGSMVSKIDPVSKKALEIKEFYSRIQEQMKTQRSAYKRKKLTPEQKQGEQVYFARINSELGRLAKAENERGSKPTDQNIVVIQKGIKDLIDQMSIDAFDEAAHPIAAKKGPLTNADTIREPLVVKAIQSALGGSFERLEQTVRTVLLQDLGISGITASRVKDSDPKSLEYRVDSKLLVARVKLVAQEVKKIVDVVGDSPEALEKMRNDLEKEMNVLRGNYNQDASRTILNSKKITPGDLNIFDRLKIELAVCEALQEEARVPVQTVQEEPSEDGDIASGIVHDVSIAPPIDELSESELQKKSTTELQKLQQLAEERLNYFASLLEALSQESPTDVDAQIMHVDEVEAARGNVVDSRNALGRLGKVLAGRGVSAEIIAPSLLFHSVSPETPVEELAWDDEGFRDPVTASSSLSVSEELDDHLDEADEENRLMSVDTEQLTELLWSVKSPTDTMRKKFSSDEMASLREEIEAELRKRTTDFVYGINQKIDSYAGKRSLSLFQQNILNTIRGQLQLLHSTKGEENQSLIKENINVLVDTLIGTKKTESYA